MTTIISRQPKMETAFEKAILNFLNINFKEAMGKWRVVAEKRRYRVKEDEAVWKQAMGRVPNIVEVWLHVGDEDIFICDIRENWYPDYAFKIVYGCLEDVKKRLQEKLHGKKEVFRHG